MKLTLTRHVDSSLDAVEDALAQAVAIALDAAGERISEPRDETQTEPINSGLRVNGGLRALNGSEVRMTGSSRLTTIEVVVPWSEEDKGSSKLWAANRFSTALADAVLVAS